MKRQCIPCNEAKAHSLLVVGFAMIAALLGAAAVYFEWISAMQRVTQATWLGAICVNIDRGTFKILWSSYQVSRIAL